MGWRNIEELPISESEQIAAAAREDDDVRVRRAAVGKLMDPNVLAGDRPRRRGCGRVRERADQRCATSRATLSKGERGHGPGSRRCARRWCGPLAQIAKASLREAIGRRALMGLERTGGSHILASVARQAVSSPSARARLEQLHVDRAMTF